MTSIPLGYIHLREGVDRFEINQTVPRRFVSINRRIHDTRWVLTSNPGPELGPEVDGGSFEAFTTGLVEDVSCSAFLCEDFPYELLYIALEV